MKQKLVTQRNPEFTEAMRQATMMFLVLHKKSLSVEEGFSLVSLWETALLSKNITDTGITEETPPPTASPSKPITPAISEKPPVKAAPAVQEVQEVTPVPAEPVRTLRKTIKPAGTLSLKKSEAPRSESAVRQTHQPQLADEYDDDFEEAEDDNRGNVAPQSSCYVMPDLDSPDYDASLPDSCKLPPVQRFDTTYWQTGYRFKITVKAKSYMDSHEDYSVQTIERPTQEEFDKHYTKFLSGDFRVHVFESRWVPGEGYQSVRITDQYCGFRETKPDTARAERIRPESLVDIVDWEDEPDAPYRIAFYDDRVHRLNYVYFRERPTERDIRTYDQTRFHATLQRRPADV
ncbi:hypothetical protein MWH03_00245 [Klebsiella pneumoniae]|nr:hypothetical protein [Klebsiella pneumoniae]